MSKSAHKRLHKHLTVNYDDKHCYTEDGVKIESVAQAQQVFQQLFDKLGIDEDLIFVDYSK